jgi:hypothetical protein
LRFSRRWLCRMPSSGMWRRVDIVRTDVSEERIASIFSVEKSAREEPAWAVCSCKFLPWRWMRYALPKRQFTQDLHGATCQRTAFFKRTDSLTNWTTYWLTDWLISVNWPLTSILKERINCCRGLCGIWEFRFWSSTMKLEAAGLSVKLVTTFEATQRYNQKTAV